jgi:DNA processing protein
MRSTALQIGEYAAALELCRSSTTKRRLLDSLVLKVGYEQGIQQFIQRQAALGLDFQEVAERFAEASAKHPEIRALSVQEPAYPFLLKEIPAPPAMLFVRGGVELLKRRCVAVVGSRKASQKGLDLAARIARGLARQGLVVVSGLARGIDAAAHRAVLSVDRGKTVAVLGTPIDRIYPAEHKELQQEIARMGLLVSQFPSGLPVSRFNFPERNRVMAGICEATVVVEAGDTSGAVIQARQCLSQGRALFITDIVRNTPSLRWPSTYLTRGALVANSAEQLIRQLDGR